MNDNNNLSASQQEAVQGYLGCALMLVMGVVGVFATVSGIRRGLRKREYGEKYAQVWTEFANSVQQESANREFIGNGSYRRAKFYVRDFEIYDALPEELLAETPAECGTLVTIKRSEIATGETYTNGATAYRQRYELTLFDCVERALVMQQQFFGGNPPKEISEHASRGTGSSPLSDAVSWLRSLPPGPAKGATFRSKSNDENEPLNEHGSTSLELASEQETPRSGSGESSNRPAAERDAAPSGGIMSLDSPQYLDALQEEADLSGHIERLAALLYDANAERVFQAVAFLVRAAADHSDEVLSAVAPITESDRPEVALAAVAVLEKIHTADAVPLGALHKIIENATSGEVVMRCCRMLRRFRAAAIPSLAVALRVPASRHAALALLNELGETNELDRLVAVSIVRAENQLLRPTQTLLSLELEKERLSSLAIADALLKELGFQDQAQRDALLRSRQSELLGWTPNEWTTKKSLKASLGFPRRVELSPRGYFVAIADDSGARNTASVFWPEQIKLDAAALTAQAPNPELAVFDAELRTWIQDGSPSASDDETNGLRITPSAIFFPSPDSNRQISFRIMQSNEGYDDAFSAATIGPEGRFIVAGAKSGRLFFVNADDGALEMTKKLSADRILDIAVSANGAMVAALTSNSIKILANASVYEERGEPPTLTVGEPTPTAPWAGEPIGFAAQAIGCLIESRVDEGPWRTNFSGDVAFEGLSKGRHLFEVRARNFTGASSSTWRSEVVFGGWSVVREFPRCRAPLAVSVDMLHVATARAATPGKFNVSALRSAPEKDQAVCVWNIKTGKQVFEKSVPYLPRQLTFSDNGEYLAEFAVSVGSGSKGVSRRFAIFNVANGIRVYDSRRKRTKTERTKAVTQLFEQAASVMFVGRPTRLLVQQWPSSANTVSQGDSLFKSVDIDSKGKPITDTIRTLPDSTHRARAMLGVVNTSLVIGGAPNNLKLWDLDPEGDLATEDFENDSQENASFPLARAARASAFASATGKAQGNQGETITIWILSKSNGSPSLSKYREIQTPLPVSHLALSPDGKGLVAIQRGVVGFWNVKTGVRRASLLSDARIQDIAFIANGRGLATLDHENMLRIWAFGRD